MSPHDVVSIIYLALGGGVSDEPYLQSSNTFTFTDQDSVILANLREYVSGGVPVDNGFTIAMNEIKSEELFDLHCLVLDVQNIHGRYGFVRNCLKCPSTR